MNMGLFATYHEYPVKPRAKEKRLRMRSAVRIHKTNGNWARLFDLIDDLVFVSIANSHQMPQPFISLMIWLCAFEELINGPRVTFGMID